MPIKHIRNFFLKGNKRSRKAKINIAIGFTFKIMGMLIGFLYFPISLGYLGQEKFGIFLAVAGAIEWFAELDLGIGNGLRNKLGESLADNDYKSAQSYVSTAYFAVGSIFSGVSVIFMISVFFIPWASLLHTDQSLASEIAFMAILICGAMAIRFVSAIIYQIFYSFQRGAIVDIFSFITKLLFLIVIIILGYTTEESLVLYGGLKSLVFALTPLLIGLYFFRNEYSNLKPTRSLVSKDYFKGLFTLGIKFFIIKLAFVAIHQTNSILIASLVSPGQVPVYEAAYKYLSIFLMLFVILTDQLWAANVEAHRMQDFEWMRKSMAGLIKVWLVTLVGSLILIAISPYIYHFWMGDKLSIPLSITLIVAASISMTTWVNMFNIVLNSTGKVFVLMWAWILAGVINIPLSIFFAKGLGLGTHGIVLGTIVSLLPLAAVCPIQVYFILYQKDKGLMSR